MDISFFSNDYTVRRMEKTILSAICAALLTICAASWPTLGFQLYGLVGLKAIPRQSIFGIKTILKKRGLHMTRITILWLWLSEFYKNIEKLKKCRNDLACNKGKGGEFDGFFLQNDAKLFEYSFI